MRDTRTSIATDDESGSRGDFRLSAQLVGRQGELERLDAILDQLEAGEARFLDLVGEPGIGKTRLVRELRERAETRRLLVLGSRASALETAVPFGVFVSALDDYLAGLNSGLFDALTAAQLSELAEVFPGLAELGEARSRIQGEERYLTHRAVRALLELLGRRKPLVICLDDLHWADEASLELVDHLLRNPPRAPCLLALARRSGTLGGRWEAALDTAVRGDEMSRIEIGPLARDEAGALLAGLDANAAERVWEFGGGNPFYLEQLAANPDVIPPEGPRAPGSEGVPPGVAAALRDELAGVAQATRVALEGAAVAGDPFDLDLAAAAADLTADELLAALDEAAVRRIVAPSATPRSFRFRHPILAHAVYEAARQSWRRGAHARVAKALGQLGAPTPTRAAHVELSAEIGDEAAIELLAEAGRAAAPRAPGTAARWFDAALRLLPQREDDASRRVELMAAMARSLSASGRLSETTGTLREILATMPPEAVSARVEVGAACATGEVFLGRHGEARALISEMLAGLAPARARERASLMLVLASIGFWSNEWESTARDADAALAAARESGHLGVESAASSLLALNAARLTNTSEARRLTDGAAERIDAIGDAELAERLETMVWLAGAEYYLERSDAALRHARRAIGVARASGQAHLMPLLSHWRDWSLYWQGRVEETREAFAESVEVATLSGSEFTVFALAGQADLAPCWAEPTVVRRLVERTLDAGRLCRGATTAVVARIFAARALLRIGDHEAARIEALSAGGGPDLERVDPAWRPMAWVVLTRCELSRGDTGAAEGYAARATDLAEAIGLPARIGYGHQARALVELGSGEFARAAQEALAAADRFGAGEMPIEVGVSEALAGRALAAGGDAEEATIQLSSALERFDECGASRLVDQTARGLRKLGHRVARPGRRAAAGDGAPALSDREREIAELVAEGQTNRQIAQGVFLSEKTVEKHLARVFEKLGVSRRGAVAAQLAAGRDHSPA